MDCDTFKELIGDYLDDEVAEQLCEEVKAHLADCGPCSVEVDSLQKTITIYRGLTPPARLSADARERLFKVLSYEYRNSGQTPRA